jgi:hypothetical protein
MAFVAEIRARSYDLQSLLHLGLGNGTALRRGQLICDRKDDACAAQPSLFSQ